MKNNILAELNASLKLGIESDETFNAEDLTSEELVGEADTGSAQSIEDVAEGEAIADIEEGAIDDTDASEAVEDLVAVVEHAQSTGTKLNRIEVAALKQTFLQITKSRYKDPLTLLPARESHEAVEFSNLSLVHESLKETAKDLGNKAIETIKKIIEAVTNFIKRHLNKYGFLTNRFKKIFSIANQPAKTNGARNVGEDAETTSKNSKVQVSAKYLAIDNKVSPEVILAVLGSQGKLEREVFSFSASTWEDLDVQSDAESEIHRLYQNVSGRTKELVDHMGDATNGIKREGAPSNIEYFAQLPGNYYFGAEKVADIMNLPKIGKLQRDGSDDASQLSVQVASRDRIKNGAQDAIAAIVDIRHSNDNFIKKMRVDRITKDLAQKFAFAEKSELGKVENKRLNLLAQRLVGFMGEVNSYYYNFLTATADYFEACLADEEVIEG